MGETIVFEWFGFSGRFWIVSIDFLVEWKVSSAATVSFTSFKNEMSPKQTRVDGVEMRNNMVTQIVSYLMFALFSLI